jgi:hypothetical protein
MGREIRRVPPDFQHPRRFNNGNIGNNRTPDGYIPKYDGINYEKEALEWIIEFEKWRNDLDSRTENNKDEPYYFNIEPPPLREDYTDVKEEECTWYQLYETVSEGTPLSPPFETREELINYLTENGDFWHQREPEYHQKHSREIYEKFVNDDNPWAPSFVFCDGVIKEGIEAIK